MQLFQSLVYLLCFAASVLCLALLVRSYIAARTPLLLWSALCFVGFSIANAALFIDVVLLPVTIDLLPVRHLSNLAAVGVLLYGFIWEAD